MQSTTDKTEDRITPNERVFCVCVCVLCLACLSISVDKLAIARVTYYLIQLAQPGDGTVTVNLI